MIPTRNKIRLARHLHAQTTPYPEAKSWVKRGVFFLALLLLFTIYQLLKPKSGAVEPSPNSQRQILGEQEKSLEFTTYKIQRGDTLFNVSKKFELSWQTIAELNHLKTPYTLRIGQELQIPN